MPATTRPYPAPPRPTPQRLADGREERLARKAVAELRALNDSNERKLSAYLARE